MSFVEGNHSTWDEKLLELNFSLNTTPHSTTGYTPAMLNFGKELTPPSTLRREQDEAAVENIELERQQIWRAKLGRLEELREAAKAQSSEQHQRQAQYYNARRRPSPYQVGDKVWKRNRVLSSSAQGVTAKLAPKYVGPYVILEIKGPNTYKLGDDRGQIDELVHSEHLKPFVEAAETPYSLSEEDGIAESVASTSQHTQPPRDPRAMSDPPNDRDLPSADEEDLRRLLNGVSSADEKNGPSAAFANSPAGDISVRRDHGNPNNRGVVKRARGRPRKATRIVQSTPVTEDSRRVAAATRQGRW